jgi:RNA polymerase sigma-70 factor (ECF subfamily)
MTKTQASGHRGVDDDPAQMCSPSLNLSPSAPDPGAAAWPEIADFEQIYEEYFDFVWRSLLRMGVPEFAADDAVQDVFIVAHRKLPGFSGRSTIKTWLFGIAYNTARDHRRKQRRKGQHEELNEALIDPRPEPEERASLGQVARSLDRALDALDEEKRAVFILTELEGMTAAEIGNALGVSPNTVSSRLRAARVLFQKAFAEQGRAK